MAVETPIFLGQRRITDAELLQLLDDAARNGDLLTFFNKFRYFAMNDPSTLIFGEALLLKCSDLNPDVYAQLHKGTPFYWLARAAFLIHDYQTAAFYIDAAVSEDLKTYNGVTQTPALSFFQIDDSNTAQASLDLVRQLRNAVEAGIAAYAALTGARAISLPEIQSSLLQRALQTQQSNMRTLATAFISFLLEWRHRSLLIALRPEPGTAEPFFMHLFKGCVLFESLLKANPRKRPQETMLVPILNELRTELGFVSSGNFVTSRYTFQKILSDVSNDGSTIFVAVERTARIRNTTGHDLGWQVTITRSDFEKLAIYVSSACLHAISCLYK